MAADYQEHPRFLQATAKERQWFDAYYVSRNLVEATRSAYEVTTDDSAKAMGRKIVARPHIVELIEKYCTETRDLPSLDDLKYRYIAIADNVQSSPREQLMALNSYERLCGWGKARVADAKADDKFDPTLDDITLE